MGEPGPVCVSESDSGFRKSVSSGVPQIPCIMYSSTDQFYFLEFILRKSSMCVQRYWYKRFRAALSRLGRFWISPKSQEHGVSTQGKGINKAVGISNPGRGQVVTTCCWEGRQVTKLKYMMIPLFGKMCVVKGTVTQSCLTLCDPMDCSPPGSSVHGIL